MPDNEFDTSLFPASNTTTRGEGVYGHFETHWRYIGYQNNRFMNNFQYRRERATYVLRVHVTILILHAHLERGRRERGIC